METAHLLDTEWTQFAESLAAWLGNPVRLATLRAVAGGIETVAGLVEELDAGTSGQIYHYYHYVNQLVARGWLAPHSRSRYRIPPARIIPLLARFLRVIARGCRYGGFGRLPAVECAALVTYPVGDCAQCAALVG